MSLLNSAAIETWRLGQSYEDIVVRQLDTIQGTILCTLQALSTGGPLDFTEQRIICEEARKLLSELVSHWHVQVDWRALLKGNYDQLHKDLLEKLFRWDPFGELCSDPRCCAVIPKTFAAMLWELVGRATKITQLNLARDQPLELIPVLFKLPLLQFITFRQLLELDEKMTAHYRVCLSILVHIPTDAKSLRPQALGIPHHEPSSLQPSDSPEQAVAGPF